MTTNYEHASPAGRPVSRFALSFEGVTAAGDWVEAEVDVDDVNGWMREQYTSGYWRYLKVWEFPTGAWVARIDVDEDGPYWSVDDHYSGGEATS